MKKIFCLILLFINCSAHALDIAVEYNRIKQNAITLAGRPQDISNRIDELYKIYLDSDKKHTFPLIAAHGAKWAERFFSISDPMIEVGSVLLSVILIDSTGSVEKDLDRFATNLQKANRKVFIDTYTNYYFSKYYGNEKDAQKFINQELLKKLNQMHSKKLTPTEKRELFITSLTYEQEISVAPMVGTAITELKHNWLKAFVLKPRVQFDYFPRNIKFKFHDFSNKSERVYYATKSYDFAIQAGWTRVEDSL